MIFVTVGTQLPFDRLVTAVDAWAGRHPEAHVVAQVGRSRYRPRNLEYYRFLEPHAFEELFGAADCIIAHAGIGTILAALERTTPIIILPRRAVLGEQRTEHQLATARSFEDLETVLVAHDESMLPGLIDRTVCGAPATGRAGSGHGSGAAAGAGDPGSTAGDAGAGTRDRAHLMQYVRSFVATAAAAHGFDGIVCFGGEDWWYHNRGHYDMQMMREASRRLPVLYVNSIGVRSPRVGEGRVFLRRITRKARSFARGLVRPRPMFSVYSPITTPGMRATQFGRWATAMQVRRAARRCGIRHPLVWVAVPSAAELLPFLPCSRLVYQRTDRFEEFDAAQHDRILAQDRRLKRFAELTLYCSHYLLEAERASCRRAAFIDHGVDFERFAAARDTAAEPADIASIPRPRVGFVGSMDEHTFDPGLFRTVALGMSDISFVTVGGSSLPDGWCDAEHVHHLGRKPYEQVADYMAACDVLIMPWRDNEWIRACNPVKLKEYLVVGRPVVSTPFPELVYYNGAVQVAADAHAFAAAVRRSLWAGADCSTQIPDLSDATWADRFERVWELLTDSPVSTAFPCESHRNHEQTRNSQIQRGI